MQHYAIGLCLLFCVARFFSRYWLLRPIHARPALVRSNEVLRVFEFTGLIALAGGFFFLLVPGELWAAALVVAALLGWDALARWALVENEARRLRSRSPSRRWTRHGARRHVRKRATTPMFS